MSDKVNEGTAEGLVDFLNWLGRQGEINPATARAYASAVTKVMEIDDEGWQSTDIKALDVENQLSRFERKRATNYQLDSLATYQSRFRKSVELYLAYLTGGAAAVRPLVKERERRSGEAKQKPTNGAVNRAPSREAKKDSGSGSVVSAPPPSRPSPELEMFRFTMSSGVMAEFHLPVPFPSKDAKRMATFLESLALDEPLALPPGQSPADS